MSSFVIDKVEYVKCAGLLFGYEDAQKDKDEWYMNDLYDWFVKCYELNVASVNEQYNDNIQLDPNEYKYEFRRSCEVGRNWYLFGKPSDFVQCLSQFFRSASYQTENEEMAKEMHNIFYICLKQIMPHGDQNWWGCINLTF